MQLAKLIRALNEGDVLLVTRLDRLARSTRDLLNVLDEITVFYRQRKIQFRVVWTKKLEGTSEFQVGLRAVTRDSEAWGLNFAEYKRQPASQPALAAPANA